MTARTRIILLGATGSIGDSTLRLIRQAPERFEIVGLTAHSNAKKLAELAREFMPKAIGITEATDDLENALPPHTILHRGVDAACEILDHEADIVVAAMMGASGVMPVMKALQRGMKVALANKEALVCAGQFMMDACATHNATLLPVDSEHNAIYQLLQGQSQKHVTHITLTASGGPFFTKPLHELSSVTPEQAVAHPKWSMGAKISVDSATMMNKGLECIEAHWLFAVPPENIDVLIHPEAVVHGMITFSDGSSFAHLSPADMTIPIAHCLYAPGRASLPQHALPLNMLNGMSFHCVDNERYPALSLARDALKSGMSATITLNAANEVAVSAFLETQIGFSDIVPMVAQLTEQHAGLPLKTIEDVLALDAQIRIKSKETLLKAAKHYA